MRFMFQAQKLEAPDGFLNNYLSSNVSVKESFKINFHINFHFFLAVKIHGRRRSLISARAE
jgi:hypothetical protein